MCDPLTLPKPVFSVASLSGAGAHPSIRLPTLKATRPLQVVVGRGFLYLSDSELHTAVVMETNKSLGIDRDFAYVL
jgi:hypothetical protein